MNEPTTSIRATIIIPVWNGEKTIRKCLDAIAKQTLPKSQFEVIVVDNGSTDTTPQIVASYDFVTLLSEPRPGSYWARNTGIDRAQGDYIAFTDSDCIPDPHWLEKALAAAEAPERPGLCGGRISLFIEGQSDAAVVSSPAAKFEFLLSFDQRRAIEQGVCATANWISPRNILIDVGKFNANLKSGGDGDMARRIISAGYLAIYVDDMIIAHPVRDKLSNLTSQRCRVLGGMWQLSTYPLKPLAWLAVVFVYWLKELRLILYARNSTFLEKCQIAGVSTYLWIAGMAEILRLTAGGEPRRS